MSRESCRAKWAVSLFVSSPNVLRVSSQIVRGKGEGASVFGTDQTRGRTRRIVSRSAGFGGFITHLDSVYRFFKDVSEDVQIGSASECRSSKQ